MSISIFRGSAGPGILRSAGSHRFPSLSRSDIAAQDWVSGRGLPRLYDKSNTASVSTGGRCRTLNTNDDAGGRYRISSSTNESTGGRCRTSSNTSARRGSRCRTSSSTNDSTGGRCPTSSSTNDNAGGRCRTSSSTNDNAAGCRTSSSTNDNTGTGNGAATDRTSGTRSQCNGGDDGD